MILQAIFKSWIQIYGGPETFLTDIVGEFVNSKYIDMAESMNISVKVTAAESAFSNGLAERHNFITTDMMDKVLKELQHLDMDLILAWYLNAKNSIANVHDFSLFQLVFGQNPTLPPNFADQPPVLLQHDTSCR